MIKNYLLSLCCLFPAFVVAQENFHVTGKIGMPNAAKAFMTYKTNDVIVLDSAEIRQGNFTFKGKISAPVTAIINVRYYATGSNTRKNTADNLIIILENKDITVTSPDYLSSARISGSPLNDENARLNDLVKKANITDKNKLLEFYREFALKNTSNYTGLTAMASSLGSYVDDEVSGPVFDMFSQEMKNTTLGKGISRLINAAKNMKPGGTAMEFTQNDVNGKPISLSDFKGKYVLLDFWASWCGPCRKENPNIVKAFNQFKEKNFTVLGVSLDRPGTKDGWVNAIKKDGLSWTQVSDLQYWNNTVARLYGVQAIPFNLLIDPNGKIIGKNLFGENLQTKLKEVLTQTL